MMILRHTSSNTQLQFKLGVIDHILPSKHPAMVYAPQKMQAYPRQVCCILSAILKRRSRDLNGGELRAIKASLYQETNPRNTGGIRMTRLCIAAT